MQQRSETVYEIGAMRFPEIAGLTWHYAKRLFGGLAVANPFPNPGAVPTEFSFGSQSDRYVGNTWSNPASPTLAVKNLVLEGLFGVGGGSLYPIGVREPHEVSTLLAAQGTSPDTLKGMTADWHQFIRNHNSTTLEGGVRAVLTTHAARLPAVAGLSGQELINWCVELFGRFGFGTGGFKPLFNISMDEIMRLMLWDYSTEYTFPVNAVPAAPSNVDFIKGIYDLAAAPTARFAVTAERGRVSDVYQVGTGADRRAGLLVYPSNTVTPIATTFDYVILALPHDAAAMMVDRVGYSPTQVASLAVGDFNHTSTVANVLPALMLSTAAAAPNARMVTAVSTLHMVRSTKVFATISNADATSAPVPQFNGAPVSAVISDSGLAASYMVPSTTTTGYKSFLISYTWDEDSTKLQNSLNNWPQYAPPSTPDPLLTSLLNRACRQDPVTTGANKWWLSTVLNKVSSGTGASAAQMVSYDWTTNTSAGGFKLDMTGDYYQSDLCFRYHTQAQNAALNNRVFLAGCSFSHLGGWLEGAFMTAINAVAGIVVSVNGGGANGVARLNTEAQKLFTTLPSVV